MAAAINANIAVGGKFADGQAATLSLYIDYRTIDSSSPNHSRDYLNCACVCRATDGPQCGGSMATTGGDYLEIFDPEYNAGRQIHGRRHLHDRTTTATHSFRGMEPASTTAPSTTSSVPTRSGTPARFAHYTINDHFEPYLEVMFMNDYTDADIAPSGNFGVTETINCDNPMLSEQQRDLDLHPGRLWSE